MKKVYWVKGQDLESLDYASGMEVFDGDVYAFDDPNNKIIWIWIGKDSSVEEHTVGAWLVNKIDQERGGTPEVITIHQGGEPMVFTENFTINVIDDDTPGFLKKADLDIVEFKLFRVYIETDTDAFDDALTEEVDMARKSLTSDDVFVLDGNGAIYCWIGKDSQIEEKRMGQKVMQKIDADRHYMPLQYTIYEGDDDKTERAFYELLDRLEKMAPEDRKALSVEDEREQTFVAEEAITAEEHKEEIDKTFEDTPEDEIPERVVQAGTDEHKEMVAKGSAVREAELPKMGTVAARLAAIKARSEGTDSPAPIQTSSYTPPISPGPQPTPDVIPERKVETAPEAAPEKPVEQVPEAQPEPVAEPESVTQQVTQPEPEMKKVDEPQPEEVKATSEPTVVSKSSSIPQTQMPSKMDTQPEEKTEVGSPIEAEVELKRSSIPQTQMGASAVEEKKVEPAAEVKETTSEPVVQEETKSSSIPDPVQTETPEAKVSPAPEPEIQTQSTPAVTEKPKTTSPPARRNVGYSSTPPPRRDVSPTFGGAPIPEISELDTKLEEEDDPIVSTEDSTSKVNLSCVALGMHATVWSTDKDCTVCGMAETDCPNHSNHSALLANQETCSICKAANL